MDQVTGREGKSLALLQLNLEFENLDNPYSEFSSKVIRTS